MKSGRKIAAVAFFAGSALLLTGGASYKLNLKPFDLQTTDFAFPSALRVLIQEDHTQPSVIVQTVYDHGSSSDYPGKEGMAHLVEHLCFRAQHPGHPVNMAWIKQLGADFNADTQEDITEYYSIAPKDALPDLLTIESARMTNTIEGVTDDVIKVEREVVRNELRMRTETTIDNKVFESIAALLYPTGHAYSRTGIGTHDTLDAITLADVKKFTEDYYKPQYATMVIVGDVDRKQAGILVQKAFGRALLAAPGSTDPKLTLVQNPKPRISGDAAEPPAPVTQAVQHMKGPVTDSQVVLGWSLPAGHHGKDDLYEITANEMANAVQSLLFPADPRDPATRKVEGLGCGADPGRDGTTVFCFITVHEGDDPEKIAKKAVDGLATMWNTDSENQDIDLGDDTLHLPGQREFFKIARSSVQASLFRDSASLERAMPISHYLHFNGKSDLFSSELVSLSKVTSFDARDLAHKYLTRERVVTMIIEPYGPKDNPPASVTRDTGAAWAGAIFEKPADVQDFAKMQPSQIAAIARVPDAASIKELTLDNGLHVVLAKHGDAPFVKIAIMANGGPATVTPQSFISFDDFDYSTKDPGQIAADWDGFTGPDYLADEITAPSGNLPAALDLLSDRVTSRKSVWTKRMMDMRIEIEKDRIKTEEKRPEIWAQREFRARLFGSHPLGLAVPHWDEIEKVSGGDFKAFLQRTWAPKNATLVVVGDIDLADAEKQVREYWGDWRKKDPGAPQPVLPPQPPPPSKPALALLDDPDATQANIFVACELTPGDVAAKYQVLSSLVTEKLWLAIRERSGASYGVYSFPVRQGKDISYLVTSGLVQNDKAGLALKTMIDSVREVKDGKVDVKDLNRTKWDAARTSYVAYQSYDSMIAAITGRVREGRPMAEWQQAPDQLANVSVKDLQGLLEPCVGHEIIAVTGPSKVLKPQFAGLGIPIDEVDWRKGIQPDDATKKAANP